jgi:hypothetical protein
VDAIVAALTTAFANASPTVKVWDGPVVSGDYSNAVYVGYDADPEAVEFIAVNGLQQWAGLGAKKRDEELDIACAILVNFVASEDTWKPTRDAAFAIYDIVGQTLRADPSLGQAPPFVAEITTHRYSQEPFGDNKWQARIVFGVHIKTRV